MPGFTPCKYHQRYLQDALHELLLRLTVTPAAW